MSDGEPLVPGQAVQLHVAYNDSWSSGFDVVAVVEGGYQIVRRSDGRMIPPPTGASDVRPDDTVGGSGGR